MISILSIVTIVMFTIVSILDSKEIKSLKQISLSKDKYIALLEKRARDERIKKNEEFNNTKK